MRGQVTPFSGDKIANEKVVSFTAIKINRERQVAAIGRVARMKFPSRPMRNKVWNSFIVVLLVTRTSPQGNLIDLPASIRIPGKSHASAIRRNVEAHLYFHTGNAQ
jgi:hypothetical protein